VGLRCGKLVAPQANPRRDAHGAPIFASSAKPATALGAGTIHNYLGLSNDGAGQTIAIVDAYDHPNIESDLNYFSNNQGLPTVCSSGQDPSTSNCFIFSKIYAQGSQPKTDPGWALEIALDVEWAHAVAPKANIVLVEAASNSLQNLFDAIGFAATNAGADVISNSWGGGEFSSETTYDSSCANVLCVFSSGDSGNPGGYPAYNPYVIAVGGTTLTLTNDGTRLSETAWSGSGGGLSQYEDRPSYQNGVNSYSNRGMPDVSYDADPNTGFLVYDSVRYHGYSGWFQVGGTSAGAPQWAAIIAAADHNLGASGPLSPVNFAASYVLYGSSVTSNLYDITMGSNGNCGYCDAVVGYDFVTGLGSPRTGIDLALASDTGGGGTTSTTGSSGTSSATTTVSVPSIGYSVSGPHDKDLNISVSVEDSSEQPVANASVSIELDLDDSTYGTATGTTNTNGIASFVARNAPSGTYTTTIIGVSGSDLNWDGTTPDNSYPK
jgi:subtilase family serine protease